MTQAELILPLTAVTSANTYTYGIDYNPVMRVVTRARGREKVVQGFLSVDPLTSSYPMLTPYQFASNTPIMGIDVDGLEVGIVTSYGVIIDHNGDYVTTNLGKPVIETKTGDWVGYKTRSQFFHKGKVFDFQSDIPGWSNYRAREQEKNERIARDGLIVTGGVITTIVSMGTATGPYMAAFGITTGVMAIGGGSAKMMFDVNEQFVESDKIPTSLLEGLSMPATLLVEDEGTKMEIRGWASLLDGAITLDFENIARAQPILDRIGQGVTVLNMTIDASAAPNESTKSNGGCEDDCDGGN